jgi:predicted ribosome quality control (RQC) complex YloA/Tae2 family protein
MKTEISSLELDHVVAELQQLKNSRIDKIYARDKKDIYIQLYKAEFEGKPLLRIHAPNVVYLSSHKPEFGHPNSFTMALRKRLTNARVISIKKMGNERIIKIEIDKKNSKGETIKYALYAELFLKGNILLVDNHGSIDLLSENQLWKEREIKAKQPYNVPRKVVQSLKESLPLELVKYLAEKMNLGGEFAEEICFRAGIDKNRKEFTKEEIKHIQTHIDAIKALKQENAYVYVINGEKRVFPFLMQSLDAYDHVERKETFNEALDTVFTEKTIATREKETSKKKNEKINKFDTIVKLQEVQLKKNKKIIEESTQKADLIYQHYTSVETLLNKLKEARKTRSWKEIKSLLKGHPVIKEIKEKEGIIVLDLETQG